MAYYEEISHGLGLDLEKEIRHAFSEIREASQIKQASVLDRWTNKEKIVIGGVNKCLI